MQNFPNYKILQFFVILETWKFWADTILRNKEANYVAQIYSRDAVEKLGLLEDSAGLYFRLKLDKTL